ncbi:MAG: helix-turn-helix domain-containing protein [Oscillospiraceae bacterium]
MNIGENIKKYRKEKGLTQKELADKIGKGFSTVQKYELNISQPPIDVLNRIADTLDINVSKLFDIENTLNQSSEILSNFNPNDSSTFTEVSFEDEVQRQEMYLKELREDTINKYDSLDLFGQKAANKYINFLAKDEE